MMTDLLRQRIESRLAELGRSASDVSKKSTGSPDTIRSWLNHPERSPRIDTLAKVAAELQTTPEWLQGRDTSEIAPNVAPAPVEIPSRSSMPNDVEVLGTAAGSHAGGAFQFEGGVIDYVRRPPALAGARDVYALYIEGSSMEPRYMPGELVIVHPHRPPRMGDAVIVQFRTGEHAPIQAMIGFFQGRTATRVKLRKLNPEAMVELNRETVIAVHKVLDMNEIFGI